jgi:dolichyl-diphosphooligosaccharide--protein glycosyltransferase
MLIYVAIKGKSADKILFLVWSIVMLMAVLGQRRFAYYYTVNAALLTGYFSWKMLDIAGLSKLLTKSKEAVAAVKKFKKTKKKTREKEKPKTFMQPRGAWVRVIVVGIVLFLVVFLPSISSAKALAGSPNYVMDEGWSSSLLWLKDNSPDPFDDPDFYYELYPSKDEFEYSETAYGVMSWWDYGHFIMQIAHRIPNANPGQAGAVQAGQFFTAQNESSANEMADKEGTKYVVIDYMMPTSKFYAMAQWAGKSEDEFYGVYYLPPTTTSTSGQWLALYYPTYYNSTVARLYNFDGKAVNSTQAIAISYEEKVTSGGEKYRQITWGDYFPSYADAQTYVANQTSGNYIIGGDNPFGSIIPLEELKSYELVYQSNATVTMYGLTLPSVKIFNYILAQGNPE